MAEFSERLKELRKTSKKSQSEIAEYHGVKPRALRFYESGDRHPDFKGLVKIANYFNVSTDYLLGRTDNPKFDK